MRLGESSCPPLYTLFGIDVTPLVRARWGGHVRHGGTGADRRHGRAGSGSRIVTSGTAPRQGVPDPYRYRAASLAVRVRAVRGCTPTRAARSLRNPYRQAGAIRPRSLRRPGGGLTPGTTHHPMPMAAGTGPASAGTEAEAEPGAAAGPRPEARPEFRHVSVLGRLAFRHVSVRGGGPGRPRRRRRRPRADASPRRRAGGRTGGSTCAGGRSRAARSGGRTGRGGLRSRGSSPGLRSLAARAAPNHGVSQKGVTPSGSTLTTWAVPGMSVSRDADAPTPSAHCSNAH